MKGKQIFLMFIIFQRQLYEAQKKCVLA